jgi:hypothetical protein
MFASSAAIQSDDAVRSRSYCFTATIPSLLAPGPPQLPRPTVFFTVGSAGGRNAAMTRVSIRKMSSWPSRLLVPPPQEQRYNRLLAMERGPEEWGNALCVEPVRQRRVLVDSGRQRGDIAFSQNVL